jgi:biotin synthase
MEPAMDAVTKRIYELVEKGLEGRGLENSEIQTLYEVDPRSKEAFYIHWAGRQLSMQSANGKAEIHAQIGLNGSPCPKNCQFCSFAVCNGVRKGKLEMPLADVVEYAKIYEESGANLILMLCTASYKFDKLLEMGTAVRAVISKDMPLLANTGDMTTEQAQQVKAAGFNGCYHAVRMGEGVVTTIPVETRLETIKNLRAAGLSLSTCVEPVGPEHTSKEITEKTRLCIDSGARSAGVGRRVAVPNAALYEHGEISDLTCALYVAVYRLATGLGQPLNCAANSPLTSSAGANLAWAEVGTNPRDLVERTEKGGRGFDIEFVRKIYKDADWEILVGPSPGWILDGASGK